MAKMKMKMKMRSSLSYPHSTRMIIICTIYLFSNVQGFNPLLQLPKYRNSINKITSKRFLSVNDYGAKGDGLTDDTKVPTTINHIFLYLNENTTQSAKLYMLLVLSANWFWFSYYCMTMYQISDYFFRATAMLPAV